MEKIIVVPEIYGQWPEKIKECWIRVSHDTISNKYVAEIINSSEYPAQTIHQFLTYNPINKVVGKVEWYVDNGNAYITLVELDQPYRNSGIGRWFFVLLRTYVAGALNAKIVPPLNGTNDYINTILIDIAKQYNENTLKVKTKNGSIKAFGDINPDIDLPSTPGIANNPFYGI